MAKNYTLFMLLCIVLAITFIEGVSMSLLKLYSLEKNIYYVLPVCILYGIVTPIFIIKALEYEGISTFNIIWNIMSTFTILCIGIFMFKETVNHLHLISLLLAILAFFVFYLANIDN